MAEIDSLFPAHLETVRATHDEALESMGFDGIAIHAGAETFRFLDDRPVPFVANPHFLHWAPVTDAPDSWIVYRPGRKAELLFCQPDDYWHLPPHSPEGAWTREFELRAVGSAEAARDALPPDRSKWVFLGEDAALGEGLGFGAINPEALLHRLHFRRAWKTGYEIACMAEASRRAARAHRAAEAAFREGGSEYAINQRYLEAMDAEESELPYGNIVALNEHGAVLHYQVREREAPAEIRSFLIDAGAAFRGYAADITRTYSSGNGLFGELIAAMDARQQQIVADCQAGADYRELHLHTHRHVAELLAEFGVLRNLSSEGAMDAGITRAFFPHGLGHLLGLQVHDIGGLQRDPQGGEIPRPEGHPFLRLTRTLEPGMVTTIEPGLYIIDALLAPLRANGAGRHIVWERVDELRPYGGVRIEDDVLVTDGAPRNLTREAFAELAG